MSCVVCRVEVNSESDSAVRLPPTKAVLELPKAAKATTTTVSSSSRSQENSEPNSSEMPYSLSIDQPVPSFVLSRRRGAISSQCGGASTDSPYRSQPRMKRRGAISFERDDSTAQYIRYLGKSSVSRVVAAASSEIVLRSVA